VPTTTVRRETASWVEPVGRVGLASQGVLYAIVGVLALQVASGHDDRADQHGAMYAVVSQPFGRVLLFVLALGLALHCAWRVLLFLRGSAGPDGAGDYAKRLGHLGRAVLYATFTWAAIEVLFDADKGGGQQREGVARVLDWPGGSVIVAIVGVVIIGTGLWHASKLFTHKFVDDLDLDRRSDGVRKFVITLGSIGYLARGICFVLVGWFVVQAAIDHDPNESGGLDNALKRLVNSEYGPGLLQVLAIGVFVFGAYRIADALVRKRDAVANA
jgi:type IV secretory pathway VirB2 component (pilin)